MIRKDLRFGRVYLDVFGRSFLLPEKIGKYIIRKHHLNLQNAYGLDFLKNAETVNLFVLPNQNTVSGGIQSIFSICEFSRQVVPEAVSLLVTGPKKKGTYAFVDWFKNDEKIYRWEQVIGNISHAKKMIIHLPDFLSGKFYGKLTAAEIRKLKKIEDLQINILNQNIDAMPAPEEIKSLYNLTKNVTQTVAHDRYASQEICDKWGIPTHLLSVFIDCGKYESYPFEKKEKIIVLSPDEHEYRAKIVAKLQKEMPDFKLVTVCNLTFSEYMDLIAKSYFTITFGEGMDGYFLQPESVGSVGIAVYNDEFFPSKDWKKMRNVYASYDEMHENIATDLKNFCADKALYYQTAAAVTEECKKIYDFNKWLDNMSRFYNKNYDFTPAWGGGN